MGQFAISDEIKALAKAVESSGEGGSVKNPNSSETITGTLSNPWGEMTMDQINELRRDIMSGNASMTVNMTLNGTTAHTSVNVYDYAFRMHFVSYITSSPVELDSAVQVEYGNNGELLVAIMTMSGQTTDVKPMANMVTTTMIIYRHPMPDEP